jgi:hypothetical protein
VLDRRCAWARACGERLPEDATARDARALLGGGYRDTTAKKGINILLGGISAMNEALESPASRHMGLDAGA